VRCLRLSWLFLTRWAMAACGPQIEPMEDRVRAAYSAADLVVLAEYSKGGGLVAVGVWKGDTASTLPVWSRQVVYPSGKRFAVFAVRTASGLEDGVQCLGLSRDRVVQVLDRVYGAPRPVPRYWGPAEGMMYLALFLSLVGLMPVIRVVLGPAARIPRLHRS